MKQELEYSEIAWVDHLPKRKKINVEHVQFLDFNFGVVYLQGIAMAVDDPTAKHSHPATILLREGLGKMLVSHIYNQKRKDPRVSNFFKYLIFF